MVWIYARCSVLRALSKLLNSKHDVVLANDRVQRIMREDNLLCLRRRRFVVTTDSSHDLPVYGNLARGRVLTEVDQLWVADITYIRLEIEFVYLGGDSGCLFATRDWMGPGA